MLTDTSGSAWAVYQGQAVFRISGQWVPRRIWPSGHIDLKVLGPLEFVPMTNHIGPAQLTPFQINCESRANAILASFGLTPQRETRWIGEPAVVLTSGDLILWIYIDGAEIAGSADKRYEKWDYRSLDELIEAFGADLSALLEGRAHRR